VRMAAPRRGGLLELAEMRLPLIALIDVILFLLMYFLLAGSLEGEERELASRIAAAGGSADASGFAPQVVEVALRDGRATFTIGARPPAGLASLADAVRGLPKEPGITVRVAGDVSVQDAAAALQACRDAGFGRIAYQAPRGADGPGRTR
jgi:biopolymer transport protein ExbD